MFGKKENVNRITVIRCVVICAVFAFFYYGLGYRVNYQPDIYGRVASTADDIWVRILGRDGRPINMFIMFLLRRGSFTTVYYLSLIIGYVLIVAASSRFSLLLISVAEDVQNRKLGAFQVFIVSILSCLTIANMFSAEFFLYIDMTVAFVLAIWLNVEATIIFVRSIKTEKWKLCLGALFFLLLVSLIYETISALFIILTLPFILRYSLSFIDFVVKQATAGICYAFPIILKSLFTKFTLNSDRVQFNQPSFVESAQMYSPEGSSPEVFILDRITFGMWGYMVLCMAVVIVLLVDFIKKKRYLEIVKGFYLSVVVGIVSLLPFLIGVTNDYKPRIYYPLGAFWGVLCIYGGLTGALNLDKIFQSGKETVLAITLFCMAGIQWLSFVQMYVDCYITNYEDKYISEMIGACIDDYEKESGDHIDRVVFYEDAVKTKYSINGWCLTTRVYGGWSEREALNMYLNRSYGIGQVDEKLALEFHSKNWDCFSNDQVICIRDTAHICKY